MTGFTASLPQPPHSEDELRFSDELLAAFPVLRSLPMTSRYPAPMWGKPIPGSDLWAFYRDGCLDHVTDLKGGREHRPTTAAYDERMAMYESMSDAEIAHHVADDEDCAAESKVYFIGHREHAIKIGVTVNLTARFSALQSHSPVKLEVFATRPGGMTRESAYHCQFAEHRLHGEWFAPHPDILAEIDRLNA